MKMLFLLVLSLAFAGCGSGESDEREETVGTEIAAGYNAQMDKARQVEDLSFEHKDRMDAALDEADGNSKKKP
jgi:hypothetical protein